MDEHPDIREFFGGSNCARLLLPEIFDLASREGIFRRLSDVSPFTFDGFCAALEKDSGYVVSRGNRRRMIRVLVDLFGEAGWLDPDNGEAKRPPEGVRAYAEEAQIRFFRDCLRHAPAYLRGEPAPFGFDGNSVAAWDRFLGCPSFRFCRKMLMGLMGVENRPTYRLLDLCHGPGWGIAEAVASYPDARLTAIDFTDSFGPMARERAAGSNIRWIGPGQWKGFGQPLPLDDGAYDGVLFCCGDPYVPRALRKEIYGDIARVLAPGGMLGILTRAYPDPGRMRVSSPEVRIATLVHDFSEGVCMGWEGFSDPDENERMFREIGYRAGTDRRGRTSFLDGTLWVLGKGPR